MKILQEMFLYILALQEAIWKKTVGSTECHSHSEHRPLASRSSSTFLLEPDYSKTYKVNQW